MKKRALLFICLTLTSGCIKVDQSLVLKKDGSGTLEITYSVPEQTVTQIKAMLKLESELAIAAGESPETYREDEYTRLVFIPEEALLRKKLKEFESYSITVDELKVSSRSGRRNVYLKVAFADIAEVAKADFFRGYGFSMAKTASGNYVWIRRGESSKDEPPPDVSDPEKVKLLRPMLGGFSFALTVKTPGQVIKTDAPIKTPVSASWNFEFDRDPSALWALKTRNMTVIFDGQGLSLPEIRQKPTAPESAQKPTAPAAAQPPDAKSGS